jgi:hypothetical protein
MILGCAQSLKHEHKRHLEEAKKKDKSHVCNAECRERLTASHRSKHLIIDAERIFKIKK